MSNETRATYDLTPVLDLEEAIGIEPGASILLSGPSMLGTEELAMDLLAAGLRQEEAGVALLTNHAADDVLADIHARVPGVRRRLLGCIDCRSESGRVQQHLEEGYVYSVPDPSDFTGIGIGITNAFDHLDTHAAKNCRVVCSSLSTMVTYSDRETTFRFCHVLTALLDSSGYLGLFTIDSDVHDDQTLAILKQTFDGLVELREHEGQREARILGLHPEPTEWTRI